MTSAYTLLLVDQNGNPVGTVTNPFVVNGGIGPGTVTINDPLTPANKVTVSQSHAADDQVAPGTSQTLQSAGVTLIQNVVGGTDRQTETGRNNVPANGIATGTQQLRSPIATTLVGGVAIGATTAVLAATKFTNRGVPAWIWPGTILTLEAGTTNQESIRVATVNYGTNAITFTALGAGRGALNTHLTGAAVITGAYMEAVDATTPDGSAPAGMPAATGFLWNSSLNGGAGGVEIQRSAAGELDQASGNGTSLSAMYAFNGTGFDRIRAIQGKNKTASTLTASALVAATSFTFASVAGLTPGQQITFERTTGNAEQLTVSPTWNGVNPVITQQAALFAHANGVAVEWSSYAVAGPGTGGMVADGIDAEVELHYDPASKLFYQGVAGTSDAIAQTSVEVEGLGLYNGATYDRATGSASRGLDVNNRASTVANGASATTLISAATTNATLVKGSTGTLYKVTGGNTVATMRYLKLFNKATAPVPGTDTPVLNIPLQPNQNFDLNVADLGISFSAGIGFAITGGQALLDATVVAAGDVVFNAIYA